MWLLVTNINADHNLFSTSELPIWYEVKILIYLFWLLYRRQRLNNLVNDTEMCPRVYRIFIIYDYNVLEAASVQKIIWWGPFGSGGEQCEGACASVRQHERASLLRLTPLFSFPEAFLFISWSHFYFGPLTINISCYESSWKGTCTIFLDFIRLH